MFYGEVGLSYITYADDVLLLSRRRRSLIEFFSYLSRILVPLDCQLTILNVSLFFNNRYHVSTLDLDNASFPSSNSVNWLGILFGFSLSSFCLILINRAVNNLRVAYRKNSPNNGRFNWNGLFSLYHSFSYSVVLFLSGATYLFKKKHCCILRMAYFRYCKFSFIYCDGTVAQ
jgi:hypothetical protein